MMKNTDLRLGLMRPEDLEDVVRIENASFSDPWTKQGFVDSMSQPCCLMLVARNQEQVVGYCCLYQILDEGEIMNVAISPDHRGHGTGLAMLLELIRLGKKRGVVRYLLDVRVSNISALKLYEKAGFKCLALQKGFYQKPIEDAWLMECICDV